MLNLEDSNRELDANYDLTVLYHFCQIIEFELIENINQCLYIRIFKIKENLVNFVHCNNAVKTYLSISEKSNVRPFISTKVTNFCVPLNELKI